MNTELQKTRLTLPEDVKTDFTQLMDSLATRAEQMEAKRAYARDLRDAGWTLQAIADLFGVSREMVRQMVGKAEVTETHGLSVPQPPAKPVKAKREYVEPSADVLARLLELQPKAQAVRSHSKAYREEAEEYTRLLNYAHSVEGVTLYRLAKRLGVTHGALRFRLARYGYKKPVNGTSRVYHPVIAENRAV
jgi:predicted transcriptional regulator